MSEGFCYVAVRLVVNYWADIILLHQPPEEFGLQPCTTTPSIAQKTQISMIVNMYCLSFLSLFLLEILLFLEILLAILSAKEFVNQFFSPVTIFNTVNEYKD